MTLRKMNVMVDLIIQIKIDFVLTPTFPLKDIRQLDYYKCMTAKK